MSTVVKMSNALSGPAQTCCHLGLFWSLLVWSVSTSFSTGVSTSFSTGLNRSLLVYMAVSMGVWTGLSWSLQVLGNNTEFQRVATLLQDTVDFNMDVNASVFETNIRGRGGGREGGRPTSEVEGEGGRPTSGRGGGRGLQREKAFRGSRLEARLNQNVNSEVRLVSGGYMDNWWRKTGHMVLYVYCRYICHVWC